MSDEFSSLNVKMESDSVVPKLSVYYSTISCLILSLIYVGSLYVWRSEHNRFANQIDSISLKSFGTNLVKIAKTLKKICTKWLCAYCLFRLNTALKLIDFALIYSITLFTEIIRRR